MPPRKKMAAVASAREAERKALLSGILADPEDDGPRLVYADWLEEHGEADRAEFIRLQCRLATTGEDDPQRAALQERAYSLEAEHREEWRQEAPGWVRRRARFERGFIGYVEATAKLWVKRG